MKNRLLTWGQRTIPPFCFALSPLIYSFARSEFDWHIEDLLESLLIIALGSLFLSVIAYFIVAALFAGKCRYIRIRMELTSFFLTTLIILFYVLYCPMKNFMFSIIGNGFHVPGTNSQFFIIGADKILFPICFGVFIGIFLAAKRVINTVPRINRFLLYFGMIFFLIAVLQSATKRHKPLEPSNFPLTSSMSTDTDLPNIYYIILDSYSRDDVLKKYYGFDNSDFMNFLQSHHFYVANHSKCNYPMTLVSLKASLGMHYFPAYNTLCDHAIVRRFVKELQQSIVAKRLIERGYIYIPIGHYLFDEKFTENNHTVISTGYQKITPLWYRQLLHTPLEYPFVHYFYYEAPRKIRKNVFRAMDLLNQAIDFNGKKFVFVHFWLPHQPYIFSADGSPTNDIPYKPTLKDKRGHVDCRRAKCIEQLKFTNQEAKVVIEKIAATDSAAIIILQSDHGEWCVDTFPKSYDVAHDTNFIAQRMPILNAYKVPADIQAQLYDSISPVNSFRFVLNHLGILHEPLLPDSHFVAW